VTKQADRADTGPIQHMRVRPAVGDMASSATFGFDDGVFILKGSRHICVALSADDELLRGRPGNPLSETSVGFVTVRAQNQPFNHVVPERRRELRFLFLVALKAEIRLGCFEQMFRIAGGMNAVTGNAGYVAAAMRRGLEDYMLAGMALKARLVPLFRSGPGWIEDL
jgi:hypothetical protein